MQQALEEKGYDLAYTWGVNLHGQKFGAKNGGGVFWRFL